MRTDAVSMSEEAAGEQRPRSTRHLSGYTGNSFWKTPMSIFVPITPSHLDVNGLIRKGRFAFISHLFLSGKGQADDGSFSV